MFNHATEWYGYYYIPETGKVCICHQMSCKRWFFSEQEVESMIRVEHWNPFLQPIFQEALTYFPQEVQNEQR